MAASAVCAWVSAPQTIIYRMATKLAIILPVVLLLLASCLTMAAASCPTNCTCSPDQKGREVVSCLEGGFVGALNLDNFSLDVEVIRISAPEDNMNALTMSVLDKFKKLEELHITRSNIPQLGQFFFFGLTRLDVLNLSQNNITQPLDHNFRGLEHLKELYLDDNRIYSLPSGTFRHLHQLKVLSIQRNRISQLQNSIFMGTGKLKVLKLNGNHLKELNPTAFIDIQELKSLECRGCALTDLNRKVYQHVPQLAHLDLSDNEIKSINPEDLSNLKNLRNLKLDGNQISTLNSFTFVHLVWLKKLNLSRNEIAKIAGNSFGGLHNLSELDLGYNRLESLEEGVFGSLDNSLQVLVLSGNYLKVASLKELLMMELIELRLANCGFADVHVQVFPHSLNLLDLSGNHLSSLPGEVLPLNLMELDLSKNSFRGMSEAALVVLDLVQVLKLDKNPWSCDLCHIVPLLERTNRSAVFRNIKCVQPYTMQGKKLGQIRKKELTWCNIPAYTRSDANYFLIGDDGRVGIIAAGMSVTLLLLTILAIVGALCYSRRHAAKYYTHEDKLAMEGESIFDTHSPLFCDGELSFKFPLEHQEKKLSIATIDEIKKEQTITNGT